MITAGVRALALTLVLLAFTSAAFAQETRPVAETNGPIRGLKSAKVEPVRELARALQEAIAVPTVVVAEEGRPFYLPAKGAQQGRLVLSAGYLNRTPMAQVTREVALAIERAGERLPDGKARSAGEFREQLLVARLRLKVGPNAPRLPGGAEPLKRYRRADGTLDYRRLNTEGVLREGGGAAHFALALFLKEIAIVAATGERHRMEEFFDYLMSTDFYVHYGLWVAGARAGGGLAYARFLQRFVRPSFVNGVLKANLVLATGMALPMAYEGKLNGRTLTLSLATLGLSSAAVTSGVEGIKWVTSLAKVRRLPLAVRTSVAWRVGGWFYTAAEMAVVLIVAEEAHKMLDAALTEREERRAIADAGISLVDALGREGVSTEDVEEAIGAYDQAWGRFRNGGIARKLAAEEAGFMGSMQSLARASKLQSDQRTTLLSRLKKSKVLRARAVSRHGSLEAYADHLFGKQERELEARALADFKRYAEAREALLGAHYTAKRREGDYLSAEILGDYLDAAGGSGVFQRLGRRSARRALAGRLGSPSANRLQTYSDQAQLLSLLAAHHERAGRGALADALGAAARRAEEIGARDGKFASGLAGAVKGARK